MQYMSQWGDTSLLMKTFLKYLAFYISHVLIQLEFDMNDLKWLFCPAESVEMY